MHIDSIVEFLGSEPIQEGVVEPDRLKCFYHKGEKLLYEINVDIVEKYIAVSADFTCPFGNMSLFEICVQWDRINIETEPEFYGEQQILVFRKDYIKQKNFKTLMIMKWPNNELSVWPQYINHD